jgi:hypothetical protein
MKSRIISILIILILNSCKPSISDIPEVLIQCPSWIADNALKYASEYSNADTQYEWGGQDKLRSIKIDCSGLVVNCYGYALTDTKYTLPFNDASVIDLYKQWSVNTVYPRPGDMIFMGDDKNNPTHISLLVKKENGYIYFVDSTLKSEDNIDGVSERFYKEEDDRFLSFGILLLKYK